MQDTVPSGTISRTNIFKEEVLQGVDSSSEALCTKPINNCDTSAFFQMKPVQFSKAVANHEQVNSQLMMQHQLQMEQYHMQVVIQQYQWMLRQWQRPMSVDLVAK